ncbi:MoaD/ThiS family protein [Macrococcus sp. S115]|uniref:MoaD/ThiS family protein n=1 Tax=Macrococcus sp. S115 TaxID=3047480 RepID=UPI0024BC9215|nr:MoaD/ThiS family protein [Macrococcus sp. S115]MDJ1111795.1 MoaD/ThiS family protein [Macrococcus sp. S115]
MKVLYFAHIKAKLDRIEDQFSFAEPVKASQFRNHLYETYPVIRDEQFQIAVNEEFVRDEDVIHNDDVVALIPPVSGG